jgi:hypothetical protein
VTVLGRSKKDDSGNDINIGNAVLARHIALPGLWECDFAKKGEICARRLKELSDFALSAGEGLSRLYACVSLRISAEEYKGFLNAESGIFTAREFSPGEFVHISDCVRDYDVLTEMTLLFNLLNNNAVTGSIFLLKAVYGYREKEGPKEADGLESLLKDIEDFSAIGSGSAAEFN